MKKKRKSRIRQTRTDWQIAFDGYPELLQPISWTDRIPEFLHISIALSDHDYLVVKTDFDKIANLINSKFFPDRRFHFNLSHTIALIKDDEALIQEIFNTSFGEGFRQIFLFYSEIIESKVPIDAELDLMLLFKGYQQILDNRSKTSVLCKYLMIQYRNVGNDDPLNIFNLQSEAEILQPKNISRIMALFPIEIGISENLNLKFCREIWLLNYTYSPLMHHEEEDVLKAEEEQYQNMGIDAFCEEFQDLYSQFRKLNLFAVFHPFIAEVKMGISARVCNLSIETVEFVKTYKGEIAELTLRSALESFILGSWLLKKDDPDLFVRFRDFSTGRQKFFIDKIIEKTENKKIIEDAQKELGRTIKEAGLLEIEVASERGDIFDKKIDQMAEEVWGKDNMYYFFYKRSSEVTHGQWKVIAKYHLSKSLNPMHGGIYWYNEDKNRFAGLIPAFICLDLAINFLISIVKDIDSEITKELEQKLGDLLQRLLGEYQRYFKTYIMPEYEEGETNENNGKVV